MRLVGLFLNAILLSVGAAAAGGAVAGLIIVATAMASTPFDPPNVSAAILGIGVQALLVLLAASYGAAFGIVVGMIPTLVLGALLTALCKWLAVRHVGLWASAGAAAGWVCDRLNLFGLGQLGFGAGATDLMIHWIIAGTVSMTVYWVLSQGSGTRATAKG